MTHSREELALRPIRLLGILLSARQCFGSSLSPGNIAKDSNTATGVASFIDQRPRGYTYPHAVRNSLMAYKYLDFVCDLTPQCSGKR